jgi:hypothetical protein
MCGGASEQSIDFAELQARIFKGVMCSLRKDFQFRSPWCVTEPSVSHSNNRSFSS